MEGIQQQEDGADANHGPQDEGVSSLPKVDPLDQTVHSRKSIFGKSLLRSHLQDVLIVKSHRTHRTELSRVQKLLSDEKKQRRSKP